MQLVHSQSHGSKLLLGDFCPRSMPSPPFNGSCHLDSTLISQWPIWYPGTCFLTWLIELICPVNFHRKLSRVKASVLNEGKLINAGKKLSQTSFPINREFILESDKPLFDIKVILSLWSCRFINTVTTILSWNKSDQFLLTRGLAWIQNQHTIHNYFFLMTPDLIFVTLI